MNMTQSISYKIELTKEEISLITKSLTGVLKERDKEQAKNLGIQFLKEINNLSEERLTITSGALERGLKISNNLK